MLNIYILYLQKLVMSKSARCGQSDFAIVLTEVVSKLPFSQLAYHSRHKRKWKNPRWMVSELPFSQLAYHSLRKRR